MSNGCNPPPVISSPSVIVKKTDTKGLGVFACKNFQPGEVVETCPVVYIAPKERTFLEKTILAYYIYPWTSTRCGVMVLGYGSIYNHSFTSNAEWVQDFKEKKMIYRATTSIQKGEEILVNYNGIDDAQAPIDWFDEFKEKYQ